MAAKLTVIGLPPAILESNGTCDDKTLDTGGEEYIYSRSGAFDTVCGIMSSPLPRGVLVVLKNCPTTVGSDNGFQAGIQLNPINLTVLPVLWEKESGVKDDPNIWLTG
jgi:hypothetical protein